MTKRMFLIVSVISIFLSCGNNSSCTLSKSFGTHSLTKKDITQTCIKEIAKAEFAMCDWKYKNEEETAKHIEYLQKLEITFGSECKEQDKTVKCPDFIPESLKLTKLSGCEVYSIEPNTDCMAQCADLYFSTDNDIFKTVLAGGNFSHFIKSSNNGISFEAGFEIGVNEALFTWFEKGADGKEIEKTASVEMIVVDPNAVEDEPAPDEDLDIAPDEDEEIEIIDG